MHKALIVDDSPVFRRSLHDILRARFPLLVVEEAGNGDEALARFDALRPNLVFMDISLPGQTGLELTRAIKGRHAGTTVIILTSYDFPEYREAARACGANHFFTKGSASEGEILALVEDVCLARAD